MGFVEPMLSCREAMVIPVRSKPIVKTPKCFSPEKSSESQYAKEISKEQRRRASPGVPRGQRL
jgi:hypothetical protein